MWDHVHCGCICVSASAMMISAVEQRVDRFNGQTFGVNFNPWIAHGRGATISSTSSLPFMVR